MFEHCTQYIVYSHVWVWIVGALLALVAYTIGRLHSEYKASRLRRVEELTLAIYRRLMDVRNTET